MATITIHDIAKRAGFSDVERFRGRDLGRKFRDALQDMISATPPEDILRFDLREVPMMDVSFIDEVFGGVAEARGRGDLNGAALLLIEADPLDVDDIDRILSGRPGYSTGLRNCVIPLKKGASIKLLGKTEEYVQETFNELLKANTLSTSDLMAQLGLANNTASTRLKVLYDLGLARRTTESGTRGYVYQPVR